MPAGLEIGAKDRKVQKVEVQIQKWPSAAIGSSSTWYAEVDHAIPQGTVGYDPTHFKGTELPFFSVLKPAWWSRRPQGDYFLNKLMFNREINHR